MYKDLQIALFDAQNSYGTYTELKNTATSLLETNLKSYQDNLAYQRQLEAEKRSQAFQQMQTLQSQEFQREQNATSFKNQLQSYQFQNQLSQSNAQFQTIGNKVYKIQNGQMTETDITVPQDSQFGVI